MAPMASKYLIIRIDDALRAALDAHCADHALEQSALIRRLLAREIGRPDLADAMPPRGRQPGFKVKSKKAKGKKKRSA